jgi:predicted  nucleic acid-binding Zn-ribbon protein
MQDKSKLGKRYSCFSCGLKFYDLNRPEPLCPKCGSDQREDPNPDPREAILAKYRGKGASKAARVEDELAEDDEVDEDLDVEDEEIEDDEEEREEPEADE